MGNLKDRITNSLFNLGSKGRERELGYSKNAKEVILKAHNRRRLAILGVKAVLSPKSIKYIRVNKACEDLNSVADAHWQLIQQYGILGRDSKSREFQQEVVVIVDGWKDSIRAVLKALASMENSEYDSSSSTEEKKTNLKRAVKKAQAAISRLEKIYESQNKMVLRILDEWIDEDLAKH